MHSWLFSIAAWSERAHEVVAVGDSQPMQGGDLLQGDSITEGAVMMLHGVPYQPNDAGITILYDFHIVTSLVAETSG